MKRPTYTPVSYIKKVFRLGERSLPKEEIIGRLNQWFEKTGQSDNSERVLDELLRAPDSPVRTGSSEAIIELTHQPHQLFDLAYRYVRDTHTPKLMEQILREVRRQTTFSWNQAARLLTLEKDPRFVQYAGDQRWFLAEWKIMNDQVYNWLLSKGVDRLNLRNVPALMEHELGLSVKEHVFIPEQDDRFLVSGDNLYLATDVEQPITVEEDSAALQEAVSLAEIAATDLQIKVEQPTSKEETRMNTMQEQVNTAVKQEVANHLRQALAILEARNHQMAQEVIGHFQESNIQAIEVLMREKHKNEQTVLGLGQVLAQFEQQ